MGKSSESGLYLHEEIILLSLDSQKGRVLTNVNYHTALAGAVITEMLLMGKIRYDLNQKEKTVIPSDLSQTGDPVLDLCVNLLGKAGKNYPLRHWIPKFMTIPHLKRIICDELSRKRVLKSDTKSVLLFFTMRIYPEVNPVPKRNIVNGIYKAIFTESREIELRTSLIISLTARSNLFSGLFNSVDLKKRKARIERILKGDFINREAGNLSQEEQLALNLAGILPRILSQISD